jgi:hypothetical protein
MAVTLGTTNITFNDNSVQSTAFDVYTGSTSTNTSYPIGTVIGIPPYLGGNGSLTRTTGLNTTRTIYVINSGFLNGTTFTFSASGSTALSGTWRRRGHLYYSDNCNNLIYGIVYQRVA